LKGTLIGEMRENIYMFSSAKTFQQTLEMSEAIYEGDRIKPFSVFNQDAKAIFKKYNNFNLNKTSYLKTEYETAIGQAQNAEKWANIEVDKNILKYLRYNATIDDRTSKICASLNGLTLPVDDKRWNTCAPLNHWKCRCNLEQLDEADLTSKADANQKFKTATGLMDDLFKSNPGKTGEVFNKSHPYFSVPKKYKEHALNNFGLPIPKKDKKK